MVSDEPKRSPSEQRQSDPVETGQNVEGLFSPRFKSLAAMAGWDEESILIASLIVEDTPDRQFKHKKRSDLHFKTPPSASSRRESSERKTEGDELKKDDSGVSCSNSVFPCMDKLREELSCAICLEICFERTTSCGHR
ncbi:uncharacterized protein LOC122723361 [Manihot esculenta]|uniref:uncharacterized protein LOC122723361 n=1 Tax=Manihot esculenta TaxID=3983 RepID=UPI001CC7A987|nr:uncharacterized protein LOC122723361 [Manihot esculenta]